MRPGPTTDQLSGAVTVGARLNIVRDRAVLAVNVPAWDVVLEVKGDSVVPEEVTYTAEPEWVSKAGRRIRAVNSPTDPLQNYGQRTQVVQLLTCDGVPFEIDLGWYQNASWEENDNGDIEVTAFGLLTRPDGDPLAWPSSPPAGATIRSEMQRMAGDLPVVLDPGMVDAAVPRTTQWGTDRTKNMQDLATAQGFQFGVKSDGYLHLWVPITGRHPVAHYTATDLGTPGSRFGRLLSAPRTSIARRPNRWIVVGQGQVPAGTTTKTVVDQNYNKVHARAGWTASADKVTFKYPTKDGKSGGYLQATWNQGKDDPAMASTLTYAKQMAALGVKHFEFAIKSSTSAAITIDVYGASKVISTLSLGDCSAWKSVEFDVPSGGVFKKFVVTQAGTFTRGHWIGIDEFKMTLTTPKTREAKFTSVVESTAEPFAPSAYGYVTARTELSSNTTAAQVRAAAEAAQRAALVTVEKRSLEIPADPRLEYGDVISVETNRGECFVGRVVAYSLPVTNHKTSMRVDVEVLRW